MQGSSDIEISIIIVQYMHFINNIAHILGGAAYAETSHVSIRNAVLCFKFH